MPKSKMFSTAVHTTVSYADCPEIFKAIKAAGLICPGDKKAGLRPDELMGRTILFAPEAYAFIGTVNGLTVNDGALCIMTNIITPDMEQILMLEFRKGEGWHAHTFCLKTGLLLSGYSGGLILYQGR